MTTVIVVDPDELYDELNDATAEHRAEAARAALGVARQMAESIRDTGHYATTLEVGGDDGSVLGTTDEAGHIIEWGSARTAPRGVLRASAEAVGARIEDSE